MGAMVRSCLGLVVFSGLIVMSSCADSKKSSRDHDAGEGGEGEPGGGTAGRGGAAGATGKGGRGGAGGTAGGAGRTGGSAGTPAGGSDDGGTSGSDSAGDGNAGSGEGGVDAGGSSGEGGNAGESSAGEGNAGTGGNGGNAGTSNAGTSNAGNAGTGNAGNAGAGNAGNAGAGDGGTGGQPSTPTGCERTPTGAVLASTDFSTDIFANPAWTRSDTSVSIADGVLSIGVDTAYDDYVEVGLTNATLPIVIELRARTLELAAISEIQPIIVAFYEGRWVDATYSSNWGWMLSNSSAYADSQLLAPAQGQWARLRVLLGTTTSELCIEREGDTAYGRVVTTTMTLPSAIPAVRVRQAWDYRYELDEMRVLKP